MVNMFRVSVIAALGALTACASPPPAPQNYVVFFLTDTVTLTPEAQQVLIEVETAARAQHPSRIIVEGHADGAMAHDATLADQRAQTVVHALIGAGIDPHGIENKPSASPPVFTGVATHQVVIHFLP